MLNHKTLKAIVAKLDLPKGNLLTIQQAATRWGVHVRTMRRWVAASQARYGFLQGCMFVNATKLEHWVVHQFKRARRK